MKNRNKVTYNQKETGGISMAYNEEKQVGEFHTPKTYQRKKKVKGSEQPT